MTQAGSPGPSNRLDRIEALLATTAEQLDRVAESQERSHQQHNQEMAEIRAGLRETRAIADSNARSIQAWESRANQLEADTEEATTSTRADLSQRIGRDEDHYDEQVRRFDQLHVEHSQRFNNLLEEARADRLEWRQRFDEQLAAMQQDREANAAEHRAFTQNVQVLLAEIARLWQRLAG